MSILSLVSLIVSVVGQVMYYLLFSNSSLSAVFIIISVVSIILPTISKKIRIAQGKKGRVLEIIAIIVGGFNFYCVFFALTSLPVIIAYLGWVIGGVAYKVVK
jgi:hypothetical protein|nr:MAG TPA: hypothetical protein [Caudoviricetes sp.]